MKKIFYIALLTLGLAYSASAEARTNVWQTVDPTGKATDVVEAPSSPMLFNAGDLSFAVYGAVFNDRPIKGNGGGAGASFSYFPAQKYAGIELSIDSSSTISFGGVFRYPIEKWHLAPYLLGGVSYSWAEETYSKATSQWVDEFSLPCSSTVVGAHKETTYSSTTSTVGISEYFGFGLEYKFSRKFGIFGDYRWIFNEINNSSMLRFGLKYTL